MNIEYAEKAIALYNANAKIKAAITKYFGVILYWTSDDGNVLQPTDKAVSDLWDCLTWINTHITEINDFMDALSKICVAIKIDNKKSIDAPVRRLSERVYFPKKLKPCLKWDIKPLFTIVKCKEELCNQQNSIGVVDIFNRVARLQNDFKKQYEAEQRKNIRAALKRTR